jgi:uncharacterized membrane protein YgaE (UPF0421/DUF939 family)
VGGVGVAAAVAALGGIMASRGKDETVKLRANIQDQLNRLITQLQDLEELREEMEADEYRETKEETLQQMREFQAFLRKTAAGDLSLVNDLGSIQLVRASFIYLSLIYY